MSHAIVASNYRRNGRDEVLVLPAGDQSVYLHPGINAIPPELWKAAAGGERAQAFLRDGVLVDKGVLAGPDDAPLESSDSGAAGGAVEVSVHLSPGTMPETIGRAVAEALGKPTPAGEKQ